VIEGNDIRDFGQHAVVFGPSVFGAVIRGNTMRNVVDAVPGMEGETAAVAAYAASGGSVFGAVIEGNRVVADDDSTRPQWFVYAPSPFASWQIAPDNDTSGVAQPSLYNNVNYLPVDRETEPTDHLVQRRGDRVYAADGRPGWTAVTPAVGYGSLDTTTVLVAVDMTAGSRTASIVPGGAENYTVLPPGMNVLVAGAGKGGSDLAARIVEIIGTTGITLDQPAQQDVSGAALRYGPLRLRPLPRGPRP
jgi:hypothetical protein